MERNESVTAVKAYEAGYCQACEDFIKAFMQAHCQAFESAIQEAAKKMDENMKQATGTYFDAFFKGRNSA